MKLSNNITMVTKRLESSKCRLSKDKYLHEKYTTVMQSYIDKGYAELVTNEGKGELEGESWYLPHHPVSQTS